MTKPTITILSLLMLCASSTTALAQVAKQQARRPSAPKSDILVTVKHTDGTVEKYSKEVASLEIVVAPSGMIHAVHLTLITGVERDTHLWYNYANLVSLRYQFLNITGKGKVNIKQVSSFPVKATTGMQRKISSVTVDDYK